MRRFNIFVVLFVFAVSFLASDLLAQRQGNHNMRGQRGAFWSQLNEDQKQQVQDKIQELRDAGKSREEIHAAVKSMLSDFGIQVPENFGQRFGSGRPGHGAHLQFFKNLTQEQKQAIQAKIKEMHEQRATREEIHKTVGEMLQSFGVELPDNWDELPQMRSDRGFRGRFWRLLNDTEKEELKTLIQELKDKGASRKEIGDAVKAKLLEFGIKPPQRRRRNRPNPEGAAIEDQIAEQRELQASNYPNPFNPETQIVYTLKNPQKVIIRIFNANGQLVHTLLNADQSAGSHTVTWNGRDEDGSLSPSGMYFYRIDAGANSLTQGMILMK